MADQQGVTLLESVLVMSLLAILVGVSFPLYQEHVVHRSVRNAAHLLQGDLRLAQQIAVTRAGSGPAVEVCFRRTASRLDGYEVYPINFADRLSRTGPLFAGNIKVANAGEEFRTGIIVTFEAGITRACLIDSARVAVAFSGGGAAIFSDNDFVKDITLTRGGQTRRVTVNGITGRITVVEP